MMLMILYIQMVCLSEVSVLGGTSCFVVKQGVAV